jgi:hypothetical protein
MDKRFIHALKRVVALTVASRHWLFPAQSINLAKPSSQVEYPSIYPSRISGEQSQVSKPSSPSSQTEPGRPSHPIIGKLPKRV